ncbi:MAG: hypothetical protein RLZ47_827 [Bacteroidota bacterium]|jgi:hypothetical protein
MSVRKQIINCGSKDYLSQADEFKDGLPKNCLFNKGRTGVGGTTLALEDDYPTVICFPYKSIIEDKVQQSKSNPGMFKYELIPYYSGCAKEDIIKALKRSEVPKILVTYDSLEALNDFINPGKFNIVIDEFHILIQDYSFRKDACDRVYDSFTNYKKYTFLSATPIPKRFLPNDLLDVKEVEAIWDNVEKVNIYPIATHSVIKTLCFHVSRLLNGEITGNFYIFVNSILIANSLIKNCNLNNENTRFIYSENNDSPIANNIKRGSTTESPKRINIITRTGFQGCDFYDEEGKIIIVSDGNREHTYVDVEMALPQIIGRIRNSKYKNTVYHIHGIRNRTYSEQMSYEDFEKSIDGQADLAYAELQKYHTDYSQIQRNQLHSCVKANQSGDTFYDFMTFNKLGIPVVDDRLVCSAKFNYYVINETYKNVQSLSKSYSSKSFNVNKLQLHFPEFELTPFGEFRGISEANKYATELLLNEKIKGDLTYEEFQKLQSCFIQFPILYEAYKLFGFEEFIGIKVSNKSNLTNRVRVEKIKVSKRNSGDRIATYLIQTGLIRIGKLYKTAEINTALKTAYEDLGYEFTIKSADIKNYFNVQETNKTFEDGNKSRGWFIINVKFENKLAS